MNTHALQFELAVPNFSTRHYTWITHGRMSQIGYWIRVLNRLLQYLHVASRLLKEGEEINGMYNRT